MRSQVGSRLGHVTAETAPRAVVLSALRFHLRGFGKVMLLENRKLQTAGLVAL